jgi:hypothetical protein
MCSFNLLCFCGIDRLGSYSLTLIDILFYLWYNPQMNDPDNLLFKVISGSHAYGLNIETSDVDTRGVFALPNKTLLGLLGYKEQVQDGTNDTTFWELNRFAQLLVGQSPCAIEILFTPEDKIQYLDLRFFPLFENKNIFLTKKLRNAFGGYAISQIKKARGLNKKIVNPVPKERKNPLAFCHITPPYSRNSRPLLDFIKEIGVSYDDKSFGLSKLDNMANCYLLYRNPSRIYRGLLDTDSGDFPSGIRVSSIVFGQQPLGIVHYNEDGFKVYCKEYRLLNMAIELGETGKLNVHREDRDWLLKVRKGEFEYDELIASLEEKSKILDDVFEKSSLPEDVDSELANNLILDIRKNY